MSKVFLINLRNWWIGFPPSSDIITVVQKRLPLVVLAVGLLGLCFSARVVAQGGAQMTSRQFDNHKESLYSRFDQARRSVNPEQQKFAYPTAKEYLMTYGGNEDSQTREVRKFVTEYERALHERELYQALDGRNYLKVFELGRPLLKTAPDHFYVLGVMTEAAYESLLKGDASFKTEAVDYARRAISLLESGKLADPKPFKNADNAIGFLNFALGTFVKDDQPIEAAAAFLKAVKSDSPFRTDPVAYHRMGVTILKGEFAKVSAEYNEKFGNKPASPEQEKMLRQLLGVAERAIDAYARAAALSDKPEQKAAREKILAQLTPLYKSFHNDSDAGLQELIASVLSKPLP